MRANGEPAVLVVEDESALSTLLRYNLEREGYRVFEARDGEEALILADEVKPDLVVLDWMLPQLSGLEICRRLRGRGHMRNVPIVMLTARGEETDRIRGLDTGADDYIVKPFSMTEFLARLRAVMRRVRPSLVEDVVTVGEISIDRGSHRVRRASRDIHLGPTEYRLLDQLMQHPGRVFPASNCWTASGDRTSTSKRARWMCMSAGCARRSTSRAKRTPSAPCVQPAIRSTKPSPV